MNLDKNKCEWNASLISQNADNWEQSEHNINITGEETFISSPLLPNYNSWQKQMWNRSPGDLSPLPMTITPLLPPGFSPTIISAWLLLHPRVRRGPRLPEKHRGEIFDISFERRLNCTIFYEVLKGLLTFLGPYPLPSYPALGTLTFQVNPVKMYLLYKI